MADSPHKALIADLLEKTASFRVWSDSSGRPTPEQFNAHLKNCFDRLEKSIAYSYKGFDEITQEIDHQHQGLNRETWMDKRRQLKSFFAEMDSKVTALMDVENTIHRNEARAQRRALLFRILTTLGVGLTIMGIYALAHCLGIPMPLMRTPL